MRAIVLTLIVFGALPFILRDPYIGVLVWSWLGYMNPHRAAWGFATEFPYAQIVAITTLIGLALSREPKKIPWTRDSVLLLILICWMFFTTFFALLPDAAWFKWDKVWKVQLFVFLTMMLINNKFRLTLLLWVIVLSLGFYGVKGGIWTIMTGGAHMVLGPDRSFIATHGEIGTALNMTIPLMRYFQLNTSKWWLRWALWGAIGLTAVAVLGTHSRGAFLGLIAVLFFLFMKSRKRIMLALVLGSVVYAGLQFMPAAWEERMFTILNWEESGFGRLNAWGVAVNTANAHPITGGGFEIQAGTRAAHSIYFQMLGEHGYLGLALFLLLGLTTWMSASWVKRRARRDPDTKWMGDLAAMIQVSAIGYGSGGAFISLAYFDLTYQLIAIIVILKVMLLKHLASQEVKERATSPFVGGLSQAPMPKPTWSA